MLRRDMADIAADHLLLRQRLLPVLLRTVVIIVVHHGTAAVVPELRRRHRRSLQVPPQIFHAAPGSTGLSGEVDLPAATVLRLQIPPPLLLITDMPQPRQATRINQLIAVAQQPDNGSAPDFFHGALLKKELPPDVMPDIKSAAGDGQVNMWILIELATVGVQRAENAHLHALFAGPAEHGPGGSAEQDIEQRPVVVKKGPQQMGHGKGDMLPVAVGEDITLLRHPLLRGFEAATAAGL